MHTSEARDVNTMPAQNYIPLEVKHLVFFPETLVTVDCRVDRELATLPGNTHGITWAATITTELRGKETAAVVPMVTTECGVSLRDSRGRSPQCPKPADLPGVTRTIPTAEELSGESNVQSSHLQMRFKRNRIKTLVTLNVVDINIEVVDNHLSDNIGLF